MEEQKKVGRPVQAKQSMCKYRRNGVECSLWHRCCKECGWNPEVEQDRKEQMRRGLHGPYLQFDFSKFKADQQSHYRTFFNEEEEA